MSPLFTFGRTQHEPQTPHLTHIHPTAAMPGGEVELHGTHLGPYAGAVPHITLNDVTAPLSLARPTRAIIRVPEGAIPGPLIVHRPDASSNAINLRVATLMSENVHPVSNPAMNAKGDLFVTLSGPRGQQMPVSIFRIGTRALSGDAPLKPFVRDILNPTGLAFDPDGFLYVSSRADGSIYRVAPNGSVSTYAEGMGIATGIAFDSEGSLFVGDRSGTIFKIARGASHADREIFVFATLEPSIAAYHLAFNSAGVLFVTGPTTSSSQAIFAIERDGRTTTWFSGLGRPQGLAFDIDDNLYVAASLQGQRGIIRITPDRQTSMAVSGQNLVGLAFLEDGACALATRGAVHHLELGIRGRPLF